MLTFSNPGLIDPRAITTFGINAKEGKNPIGHFGTGLKYAIAVILRLGGKITIETHDGTEYPPSYSFSTLHSEVRGKSFSFIQMEISRVARDPVVLPMAFTTELGKNWMPWQAYRELRSNMQDEGGAFDTHLHSPCTYVLVDCPEVEQAHATADHFFLPKDSTPLWENDILQVFEARTDGPLFYRGIRVAEASRPCTYTYNLLKPMTLTEDRTVDLWNYTYDMTKALGQCDNEEICEAILLAPGSMWEASLSFDYTESFSPEMRAAIRLNRDRDELNSSAKRRARSLYAEDYIPTLLPMTKAQKDKVAAAIALVTAFGDELPWAGVRLALLEEGGDMQVVDNVLYVAQDTFDSSDWLPTFIDNFMSALPWTARYKSAFIMKVLRAAIPKHKAWGFEAQPEAEAPVPALPDLSVEMPF